MRDYQQKSTRNPYYLPHTVYRRALALVRDYPRMCRTREEIILSSSEGRGGGSGPGRPTEVKALKIASIDDDIRAVERALAKVPQEYRQGILDNILYGIPQDRLPNAARRTWSTWRARFLYQLAHAKRWL